jgi:hypothetical protein
MKRAALWHCWGGYPEFFRYPHFKSKLKSKIVVILDPNVAKIPYRRVGCAHQISLISFVKGGQSPPYTNNTGLHYG